MTEENKVEEHKHIEHVENKEQEKKIEKVRNRKEIFENVSFYVIVISAIMVAVGIGLGSFIQYTVFIAVIGSFFVMVGIVIYIASQFMEEAKNG